MSTNTLLTGQQFCATIPTNATSIVFCDETAPTGVSLVDVSEAQDNGVVAWMDGSTYKVSTQRNVKALANADSSYMFKGKANLTSIEFDNFDTSKVENMTTMFYQCTGLTTLDVSSFNTSNVTNMQAMFGGYGNKKMHFKSLDISNFDTSKVENMYMMFNECIDLENVKFSIKFKTDNVKNMRAMFNGCQSLTALDLSNFNTNNVEYMDMMIQGCLNLKTLKLGNNFKTDKVKDMSYMFFKCNALEAVDVSNWNTENVENMYAMFSNCKNLKELAVDNWDVSKCKNIAEMFNTCVLLEKADCSKWDTKNVESMNAMFQQCNKLQNFSVKNWDTSSCTNMAFMFYGCSSFKKLDCEDWDVRNVQSFDHFMAHSSMEEYDVSNWHVTSACTNLNAIFHSTKETYIDVTGWDTSNVIAFNQIFDGMQNLEKVDGLETWNTSKGVCFAEMFHSCRKLKEINLSSFDTRKANVGTQISANGSISYGLQMMFEGCSSLEKITLGPNFSFIGNGNISPENYAVLPTPAGGYWYTFEYTAYTPREMPNLVAATYYSKIELVDDLDITIKSGTLRHVAEAIRAKNGSTDKYLPSEFANAILSL